MFIAGRGDLLPLDLRSSCFVVSIYLTHTLSEYTYRLWSGVSLSIENITTVASAAKDAPARRTFDLVSGFELLGLAMQLHDDQTC